MNNIQALDWEKEKGNDTFKWKTLHKFKRNSKKKTFFRLPFKELNKRK